MRALASAIVILVISHCESHICISLCHHYPRFASVRLFKVIEDVAPFVHDVIDLVLRTREKGYERAIVPSSSSQSSHQIDCVVMPQVSVRLWIGIENVHRLIDKVLHLEQVINLKLGEGMLHDLKLETSSCSHTASTRNPETPLASQKRKTSLIRSITFGLR
jgi:hypothetical protein